MTLANTEQITPLTATKRSLEITLTTLAKLVALQSFVYQVSNNLTNADFRKKLFQHVPIEKLSHKKKVDKLHVAILSSQLNKNELKKYNVLSTTSKEDVPICNICRQRKHNDPGKQMLNPPSHIHILSQYLSSNRQFL